MEPEQRDAGWAAGPETKAWTGYAVAVAGTAVAALVRWAIGQWVGEVPPFITFYPVAIIAAVLGGTGAGILAAVLSGLAADFFFIPPIGRLWPLTPDHITGMGIFIGINIAISIVGGRLRAAYGQLRLQVAALAEQARLAQLRVDTTQALQQPAAMQVLLQNVAVLLVERLEAAFARVWTLDATGQTLELKASAGLYTHLNGAHGRVPVGQQPKIGRIALERHPLVTNQVIGDPQVPNQDWARREGLVAFAGFPLLLEGRLLGVVALFARHTLSPAAVETFQAVAGALAQALARKQAEESLRSSEQRLAAELADMKRLHEVSIRFVRQGDLKALLEAALDAAIAITGATKGHVQLLNAASGELGIAVHRGYDQAFVEFFSHIRVGTVACGTAMQTRQCVIVEDVTLSPLFRAEPRALELMLGAGVRAVVCTPLVAGSGRVVGVLSAHFGARHQPAERDLRLLDLLASQAADFIERRKAEEELRSAREELARANADLERKVQERTAKLREAMEELEGFSYSIVHDMRAPLRAMQNFATLAQEMYANCAQKEGLDYFRRIRTASNRLDQLITDALNYSTMVRQELPVIPVDAARLLRDILETYPNFQPPAVEIRIDLDSLVVLGNEAALTQVFSNLLGNAVKFVAPGVKPCVRVRAEESQSPEAAATGHAARNASPSSPQVVRIWIEDNGIGIPKEAHEKIFGMFQRMHRAEEYPGTGIGLAIVHKALERMGGRVGVESEPGRGSRFWVELAKGEKRDLPKGGQPVEQPLAK